jgi:RNA polymerase sigma-70 factor (ECF subfamily)
MGNLSDDEVASRFNENGHWQVPPVQWDYSTPEQILEESQLKKCIEATLVQLPEQQQAVFSMRYMENYSLSEICNILELSDSNVRVILHRGRNKLLETIERFQVTGKC